MVAFMVRAVRFSKGRSPLQYNTCRFLERVTTAAGIHLFPSRTEKLSPPAPMVLRGSLRGRVGRRPFFVGFRIPSHDAVGCQRACLWARLGACWSWAAIP